MMEMSSPVGLTLRSPPGAYASEGGTPSALRLQCVGALGTPRGFVRWGTPGCDGAAAPAGRADWWQAPPSATAGAGGAGGWTPVGAAMRSVSLARGTPPYLRDRLTAPDAAAEDAESVLARWADVSSASTQVFLSADGGSEFERVLLFGCADPLPSDELDERCVSAALALTLVRSAPPSPLVLGPQPRGAHAKGAAAAPAKKAAAAGASRAAAARAAPKSAAAAMLSPAQPAAPPAARSSKRKRSVAAASPAEEEALAAAAAPQADEAPAAAPASASAAAPASASAAAPRSSGRGSGARACGWTREEDDALIQLTLVYGERSWATVAAALGCGRSGKQARERFMYIKPGLKHGPWTEEEERLLMEHHAQLGNRWAEIARLMQRPDNVIKNRYYVRQKQQRKAAAAGAALPVPPPPAAADYSSAAVL